MSTRLTQLLAKLTNSVFPGELPLKTSIISLLVYVLKEFLKHVTFSCPEVGYEIYGALFLYAPAVSLFCLSLLASDSFWTAMTCCCQKLAGRKLRLTWWKARKAIYLASLLPLSWLVFAFVDTKFYVCACLGPEDARMAKANTPIVEEALKYEFPNAASRSQVIAWCIMLSVTIIATIVITVIRSLHRTLDPKIISKEDVDREEADKVVHLFHVRMKPLLQERAEGIVDSLLPVTVMDTEREDVIEVIKRGIDILVDMYPAHGGLLNGLYKDSTNGGIKTNQNEKESTSL